MTTIREAGLADLKAIARVNVESWLTTYRGIVPAQTLARQTMERAETRWTTILSAPAERGFTYVAEDESRMVVGYVNGGAERTGNAVYRGELYAIYLLAEQQRRGTGRRLTLRLAQRLVDEGFASLLVWVLAENRRARQFYEALGGEQVYEQELEMDGARLPEVAYGWRDIATLLSR